MKTRFLTSSLLALLMFCTAALTSCSKGGDPTPEPQEGTFDINNPEGYFLYVTQSNNDDSYRSIWLFEFLPGKMVKLHSGNEDDPYFSPYAVIDDNTIDLPGIRFVFNGNSIMSNREDVKEIVLIKAAESNQLAGKTFVGTYYKADKSVLHPNFFYSFAADLSMVDAGLKVGTPLRTENYTPIGNFAARDKLDNGDIEFMVLVNGKLEVNYNAKGVDGNHYGIFLQQ